MNIIGNFKEILTTKYAKFNGRADREEFWGYILVYVIIVGAIYLLSAIFNSIDVLRYIFVGINSLIGLALLVPTLAVSVRRLHDIGKGGGWIFISLVPIVGSIWYIILLAQPSEPAPNRFG